MDSISHDAIEGWAANDAAPQQIVDITIRVNLRQVARITCDLPRDDLRDSGQYGAGNHGYLFHFPTPLPRDTATRVTVVFSDTGTVLARGDWMLDGQGATRLALADPVPDEEPVMLPAPRDPRAIFELLCWHEEHAGLYPLLRRIDTTGLRPQDAHYGVLGAWPDRAAAPDPHTRYYPRDHLNELLVGDAFQTGLVSRLAAAYPEKRRLIFVHVPKCAGTDLSNKLKTRYPWVDHNIMDPAWTTKPAMLRHLARLAVQLRFADSLFLCGHGGLDTYLDRQLIRPIDQPFTIVRHPLEIMVSQLNYVLTRFARDAETGQPGPDTLEWLELIGQDGLPPAMTDEFARGVTPGILRQPDVVRPNSLCFWLGGEEAGADVALAALINSDIEITDTDRYRAWLRSRWNIVSDSRDNASTKFATLDTLPRELRDYMREISQEDMRLYQTISDALAKTDRPSIQGHALT